MEGRKGTPERPLSDLGFRSYVVFWAIRIIRFLLETTSSKLTIQHISDETNIDPNDVHYILENFRILRKSSGVNSQMYMKKEYLEGLLEGLGVKRDKRQNFVYLKLVNENKLLWEPFKF